MTTNTSDVLERLRARRKYCTGRRKREGLRLIDDAIAEIERLRVACGEMAPRRNPLADEHDLRNSHV